MARSATKPKLPAPNPEIAEQRCIDASFSLALRQLEDGSASPSVITHFLKMGTEKTRLEREKLEKETALLKTREHAIRSAEQTEKIYSDAVQAMKIYTGQMSDEDDEDDY
ncbi:MAG: hypothetical protein IKW90_15010 [Lachnospiraceae bacterium]|nr:hypothetical protein [Lachnospiraceae bacterium]